MTGAAHRPLTPHPRAAVQAGDTVAVSKLVAAGAKVDDAVVTAALEQDEVLRRPCAQSVCDWSWVDPWM